MVGVHGLLTWRSPDDRVFYLGLGQLDNHHACLHPFECCFRRDACSGARPLLSYSVLECGHGAPGDRTNTNWASLQQPEHRDLQKRPQKLAFRAKQLKCVSHNFQCRIILHPLADYTDPNSPAKQPIPDHSHRLDSNRLRIHRR